MRIYTDGSYKSSIDRGGIGVVWVDNDNRILKQFQKEFFGCTNNQMELMGISVALQSIQSPINSLEIISDSQYAIGVISKGWTPKKNTELVNKIREQLIKAQSFVKTPIVFTHQRGHQGERFNELCDTLANGY